MKKLKGLKDLHNEFVDVINQLDEKLQDNLKKIKKEYQKNNPDKVKRWNKEWAKNNSEKIKEKQKKIRSTKKFKRWRNNYEKEKRLKDPAYKLRIHLSTKIREAIKKNNSFKGSSILKHLPYTLEQLIIHLENQFDNKMNWENHGSYWHIDHIIPQKSLPFDCLESENFKKCWALENLRPLEKTENLKKGSKLLNEVNNVGSA